MESVKMNIDQRFAIRYDNKLFHCWDHDGEYSDTKNVDEAHLVVSLKAAKLIADEIRKDKGRDCEVLKVEYLYGFVGNLEKRSR